MAKTSARAGWMAKHRYGDVYECSNGEISLSHSIKGLEAARETLETNGGDFALKQLEVVNAKLEAIKRVTGARPPVETPSSEE